VTFDQIVDGVRDEGGFDVARSQIEGWVNEVHKKAVADSRWLMRRLTVATTVADQGDYAVPDGVVEIDGLYLADEQGAPADWQRITEMEMWNVLAGRAQVAGSGGVFAPSHGAADQKQITLFPAPEVTGREIVALASMLPATMVAGSVPVIPEDMHGDLKDGAIALGLLRMDERADSAVVFDQRFERMIAKLGRRKNSRIGSRTARLRVFGHDWRR
jgi:hypothetical protein